MFSGKPSAINVACSVWEEGNEKGLKGTSSVPYFIREGAVGNVPRGNALAAYFINVSKSPFYVAEAIC